MNAIQTVDIGGKDKFSTELPLLINMEGFNQIHAIGFVRDAEDRQAASAFQSICTTLQNNKLPVPDSVNTIKENNSLRVSVFIMPDNRGTGMLENLCLKTLEGQIKGCIDEFISCFSKIMLPEELKKFNEPKARVQSYLSSRVPIVNSLGLAAQQGYWNFNHNCFDEIKTFLHSLFA